MSSLLQSTPSSPYVLVHIVGPLAATVATKIGALLKNKFTLRQNKSGTLRGKVFVSFIHIQSELVNVSVGVGYVYCCNLSGGVALIV